MDISDLPVWFLDAQRSANGMMYGRIPLELVVSGNKVTKVIGTESHQTKFRSDDEAKIFALDQMNTGPDDGTVTFSVTKKNGKISQINTFKQIEHHYEI